MVVLDTHAWLWWEVAPDRLTRRARKEIAEAQEIAVPSICCWELATLERKGRLALDRTVLSWARAALAADRVTEVPTNMEIAVAAGSLDGKRFPGDPGDRLIYSTAAVLRAPLITADAAITAFDPDRAVWD